MSFQIRLNKTSTPKKSVFSHLQWIEDKVTPEKKRLKGNIYCYKWKENEDDIG